MGDDAARLFARLRAVRNPRYLDALSLFSGNQPRARAAVAELDGAGLIEHRNNGELRLTGRGHDRAGSLGPV